MSSAVVPRVGFPRNPMVTQSQVERLMNVDDPLHHLNEDKLGIRGVRMSLDEVFSDAGFEGHDSRPFRRLVVEELHDSFGMPPVLQAAPTPTADAFSLPLHDGSPAARRDQSRNEAEPPPPPEFLLAELRAEQHRGKVMMEGTSESLPVQTEPVTTIPLHELRQRLSELESGSWLVVCERGTRSAEAVRLLRHAGAKARYVGGGLLWVRAAGGGRS